MIWTPRKKFFLFLSIGVVCFVFWIGKSQDPEVEYSGTNLANPEIQSDAIDTIPTIEVSNFCNNPFLVGLPLSNMQQVNAFASKAHHAWKTLNSSEPHNYLHILEREYVPWIGCPNMLYLLNQPGDGGRWVCGLPIFEEGTILSLGSGNQWQFEEAMIKLTNYTIETYDCTNHTPWIPPIQIRDRVTFIPRCIYSLAQLLSQYKTRIPLLKMDIEQNEFSALESLFPQRNWDLLPYQMLIEVHWMGIPFDRLQAFWMKLYEMGYRIVATERNPFSPYCLELTLLLYEC
jgi:hypothetical protein